MREQWVAAFCSHICHTSIKHESQFVNTGSSYHCLCLPPLHPKPWLIASTGISVGRVGHLGSVWVFFRILGLQLLDIQIYNKKSCFENDCQCHKKIFPSAKSIVPPGSDPEIFQLVVRCSATGPPRSSNTTSFRSLIGDWSICQQ